jgi:hypothetical protein
MHYAILDYVDRRSLDASAYDGGLYTVTPQHDDYGGCAFNGEMTQLPLTVVQNDNCPTTFPTTPTPEGTQVTFDLVHATSNKLVDPQFTDVNCNGAGTQVTNNAYFAFRSSSNSQLNISIASYTTVPPELASCSGQGIRMTIYDISTCPAAQNYPPPVACVTFTGDGGLPPVSNLQPDHDYLLYFDGLRNTKASFVAAFNGTGVTPPASVLVYPNPVKDLLYVSITAPAAAKYGCSVYDMLGRKTYSSEFDVVAGTKIFHIPFLSWARGVYIVKISDGNGNVVLKKSVVR